MAKSLQVQHKGKVIRLAEIRVKFDTYAWNKLPKSSNPLSMKDKLRLEMEMEDQMAMQRAFING